MSDQVQSCLACGQVAPAGAGFCARCGRPLAGEPDAAGPVAPTITWELAFPLLTNRFVLLDFVKVFGITYLISVTLMGTIFLIQGEPEDLLPLLAMFAYCVLGLALLSVLVMLIFFGNRFPTRFTVSADGAMMETASRRALAANRLATVLGLLGGSASTAGAGLLAQSQEQVGISWEDVYRVTEHPAESVITLRNSWRTVIRLYCTPMNYAEVADAVRRYAAEGARRKGELQASAGPSPLPRLLLLSLATVVAGIATAAVPLEVPGGLKLLVPISALLAIWLACATRFFGVLTLAGAGAFVYFVLQRGLQVGQWVDENALGAQPVPDWMKYRGFDLLHGGEWVLLALAGAGLAWMTWVGVRAVRAGFLERQES